MRHACCCIAAAALIAGTVQAGDPSPGWLTYAQWTSPAGGRITMLNTTWVVPSNPSDMAAGDSGAPGWWFGIQNTKGNGALIQPILAWGYLGPMYTMFNGVFGAHAAAWHRCTAASCGCPPPPPAAAAWRTMTTSHCSYSARHDHTCASKLIPFILVVLVRADWTDTSWHTSPEKFTVKAGDTMVSSIVYTSDNSYTMRITSKATGKTISTPYKIEAKQTTKETTAYFVLEHTPRKCAALSAAGEMSFENIYLEVVSDEPLVATLGCDPRQQTRPPSVLHGSVLHQPALPPARALKMRGGSLSLRRASRSRSRTGNQSRGRGSATPPRRSATQPPLRSPGTPPARASRRTARLR
jgi:hypothetical protein